MSLVVQRAWRALTRRSASTDADARDPRLRRRTYAIPFEDVWQAALSLIADTLPRWRVIKADDHAGWIFAAAEGRLVRFPSSVAVRIGLDENGQTCVDARASSEYLIDFGVNARRIDHCLRSLDERLEARTGQASPQMNS